MTETTAQAELRDRLAEAVEPYVDGRRWEALGPLALDALMKVVAEERESARLEERERWREARVVAAKFDRCADPRCKVERHQHTHHIAGDHQFIEGGSR